MEIFACKHYYLHLNMSKWKILMLLGPMLPKERNKLNH